MPTAERRPQAPDSAIIRRQVQAALDEDGAERDLTAALIDPARSGEASIITREPMVLCGRAWADQCLLLLDPAAVIEWRAEEGAVLPAGATLVSLRARLRALLSAERSMLNFLQTLSATATVSRRYAELASGSGTRILDTRKTLPGLRQAQKYAVRVGGCDNHRMGLHDGILIKENHIVAAGSIAAAVASARRSAPGVAVEVEVESLDELAQAIDSGAERAMLDEFDDAMLDTAVALAQGRIELEVSGSVDEPRLRELLRLGVDCISIGALTKHVRAIDLSMRISARDAESVAGR